MSFERRHLLQILSCAFGSSLLLPGDEVAALAQNPGQPASPSTPAAAAARQEPATEMEKVTGIGGFFFRAHDPKALARWYSEHLGLNSAPAWQQEAGPTSFTPFPETTKYFGDPQKMWMLNLRVRDLSKMVAQLQKAGIAVEVDPQSYPYGRFAQLKDPEGNPIQLWQPA